MQHRNVLSYWSEQKLFHVDMQTGELLSRWCFFWSGWAVRLNDALLPFAEALWLSGLSYRELVDRDRRYIE